VKGGALNKTLRWLLALLVLLNIGLLMWASWYRETPLEEGRTPLPAVNAERMIPLSTPGLALRARPPARKPPVVASAPAPVDTPAKVQHCVSIGPFESSELAEQNGKRLVEAKIAYQPRTDANRIESSYWVYLPRLPSRKAAENKRKELTRLGIEDHFIMQEPGMENVLSLGLFTQLDNAQRRMQELASKGIKAKQETRYRTRTLYWLDIPAEKPDDLIAQLKTMEWTEAELQQRPGACGDELARPVAIEVPPAVLTP
jgi:hypothetical protein